MSNSFIEQKKNNHLYFRIGEYQYAVNTENVLEIMKLPALDYPQRLPNNIVGLLKYNNFVINVIDIRFYLNIDVAPYNANNELLIVKTDEVIFGIITDSIIGILPFDTSLVDHIPFADNHTIIESLYRNEQETVFIVNIYALETLLKSHDTNMPEYDILSLLPQDETSKAIMAKRTKDIADKAAMRLSTGNIPANDKYISINLNNDYYCISLDYVKEILKDVSITNVPGTPDYIEGIMNLRGDYITVINLKKFLGLPNDETGEKKPAVIIQCNDLQLALLADKINELFEFDEPPQENTADSYYSCQFISDSLLYTVLNIEKISSDKRIVVTDM
jgi:purine-binding chemotaxis protein CheW